jgi:hypothetical protein
MSQVWYYVDDNVDVGPVSRTQLRLFLQSRRGGRATLVWCERFDTWKRAGEVPELADMLGSPAEPVRSSTRAGYGAPARPQHAPAAAVTAPDQAKAARVTTMSRLLDWFRKPSITSTIVFDERYCHSAGPQSNPPRYGIDRGTTEIVFVFPDFKGFMSTYLLDNPYLPDPVKQLLAHRKGVFCAQVVQKAAYVCTERVGPDGRISLRPVSLKPLGHTKRLRSFSNGAIAFGIFQPDVGRFHVLWATMYKTSTDPSAA